MSNEAVYVLMPEIILVLAATLVYLGGAFLPARSGWSWLAAAAIVLAGVALYRQNHAPAVMAALDKGQLIGPLTVDGFSALLRWCLLGVGLLFVALASRTSQRGESSEFMGSLLLIVTGLMMLALASDLVTFFVALELVSIPTYVILFLGRGENLLESGTKYFFLSVLSSAILLYGFSFLYGATGSANLPRIHHVLAEVAQPGSSVMMLARLALVLIVAGLGFRLTIVPFHFYAPDVYQGTTHPNAALLAVVPKIAGLIAIVRIVSIGMPGLEQLGWPLMLALALVTMTLGNLLALWQNNIRRLLAYSSIAHGGYMLIGLAVGFAMTGQTSYLDGVGASFFYLLVYAAATAGTFAALAYLSSEKQPLNMVDDLAGLNQSFPKTAAALALFMLSLTGLPPLAGFWGKLMLFTGALNVGFPVANADQHEENLWHWFVALAIVGALNAAISAAYYLRIVAVIYFRPAAARPEARGGAGAAWAMAACAVVVLGVGCYPGPAVERANQASQAARSTYQNGIGQATAASEASHVSPADSRPARALDRPKLAER